MRVEDYYPGGKRWWVRLHEKGGKRHEMPAHHKLEQFLDEYLAAAGIRENGKTPSSVLTDKPMNRVDAYRMVRRRTADAGFRVKLGCHVFRATGITADLEAGGTLENAQAMAAHESPRTTSFTTAPATRSRSMRSSGSGFSGSPALSVFRCMSGREKRNHLFKLGVARSRSWVSGATIGNPLPCCTSAADSSPDNEPCRAAAAISAGPCDLWWLVIPSSAALARIIIAMDYDQSGIATTYDEARALTPARRRHWQRLLSAHVDRTAISVVVDLGCGTGRFSEMLAAELGARVIGLDPSEKMIDQARRKPATSPVAFAWASAHELALPEHRAGSEVSGQDHLDDQRAGSRGKAMADAEFDA
jgi:hypothetical protein